jgi:hypothetical protein
VRGEYQRQFFSDLLRIGDVRCLISKSSVISESSV